jgi:hypothetical protein
MSRWSSRRAAGHRRRADRLAPGSPSLRDPAWDAVVMSVSPLPQDRNRRATPRKAIRRPATVTIGDVRKDVQTWDLGRDGMCLIAQRPITPGTRCRIAFELPLGGEPLAVDATAKIVYSSYSAAGEFRIGAVFLDLDGAAANAIGAFAALS